MSFDTEKTLFRPSRRTGAPSYGIAIAIAAFAFVAGLTVFAPGYAPPTRVAQLNGAVGAQ